MAATHKTKPVCLEARVACLEQALAGLLRDMATRKIEARVAALETRPVK